MVVRKRSFVVPQRLPYLLPDLRKKMATLGDLLHELWDGAHALQFEALADELYVAFRLASDIAPDRSYTGCPDHPNGAVDPEAPADWGLCLLCNDRRRFGRQVPAPRRSEPPRRLGYPLPAPPYTFTSLCRRMYLVNERVHLLELTSPEEDFAVVADLLHEAFIEARELSRATPATHCARHPGTSMTAIDEGPPRCLLCEAESRRARRTTAPALPPAARLAREGLRRRLPRQLPPAGSAGSSTGP
ncbi:hypothetical protein ACFQLX_18130 [Streptomyces polyrhachis]|uniref:Uncharacterized protein n=1 Tax=Streptomyces polyrhachis TaxID=1282885 RepID=A0ABW2GKD5_9ACTN